MALYRSVYYYCYYYYYHSLLPACSYLQHCRVFYHLFQSILMKLWWVIISYTTAVWHGGNSVAHIDEVTWRRARLVLRWVTFHNRVLRQSSLSTPREMKNSEYAAVGQWQRSAAGKVTVGLASHQLCVRKTHRLCDCLYYQPFDGHKRPRHIQQIWIQTNCKLWQLLPDITSSLKITKKVNSGNMHRVTVA